MADDKDLSRKGTEPTSDGGRTDPAGDGGTRGDSVDETRPMRKITGNEKPEATADDTATADTPPEVDDDRWDPKVTHEPSESGAGAGPGHAGHESDEHEELDWGERWKITRQFVSMSRSSAVLIISFLLVLLLYLWVKEDPLVTVPANDPAEASDTADPSETTEPTGETSATETSEAEPTDAQDASTAPTGAESADPTPGNQGAGDSQVPTQGNTGQGGSQTGGTGDSGANTGDGTGTGTDGTGDQTGQGTQGDASGQGAEGGTAQGAGTGQSDGTGDTGGANAA
ncbi:MAG TPA: hypothetical protein K8V11_13045 [Dietzia timorensis]|uniref:Uncharacterized protein n=1 Tax=Dietzia timorensis TaxID=499555 RepID=A0A921JZ26_9ACTN|nr:hypothetical protein [Dietzia timorensis]HJE91925.1 hypothetical protein [Dietzia timorensis]